MNTSDLFEMASLDALGLLDTEERCAFEEAFRSASPSLKEDVCRQQRRLTDLEDLLPDVEPPTSLRGRVIAAVFDAMAAMAPKRTGDVLAKIGAGEWSFRRNVSPIWRAACLGFATATVVLIAVGFHMRTQYEGAMQAFRDRDITELIAQRLGASFVDPFFNPKTRRVSFESSSENLQARAVVLIDPDSKTAFLVTRNLPMVEGEYRLVIVDDAGSIERTLANFAADGQIHGTPIRHPIEVGDALAIMPPSGRLDKPQPLLYSL